jgi:hypothetical protein
VLFNILCIHPVSQARAQPKCDVAERRKWLKGRTLKQGFAFGVPDTTPRHFRGHLPLKLSKFGPLWKIPAQTEAINIS